MSYSFIIKIAIGFLIVAAIAWGLHSSFKGERPEVEKYVEEYFKLLESQQYDKLLDLYDPEFFENMGTTREQYLEVLLRNYAKLGAVQDYRLVSWTDTTHRHAGEPAQYFKLNFLVTYANDTAEETFNLQIPRATRQVRILSHAINPRKTELEYN